MTALRNRSGHLHRETTRRAVNRSEPTQNPPHPTPGNHHRYEGLWANGQREGEGRIFFPSGDVLTAVWKAGVIGADVRYSFAEESIWADPFF